MSLFGFNQADAQRIARTVKYHERRPQNRSFARRLFPVISGAIGAQLAISGAGGIAARSGSTPGKASVTLCTFDGTTITTGTTVVDAYNLALGAVGASKYLILISVLGYNFVVWEDCS